MGVLVIPEGKTVLFRIAIFIGLGTVVTTIIYLTPVPALVLRAMDSSYRTLAFRSSIVVGLATAVATVLYLTPLPDQYPQSCLRPCHELDWPMICRVKLTLERYHTLGSACKNCPDNKTNCYNERCITADGHPKGIMAANRQFPGPAIQVCQHDIVVVDVVNRIPGQSFGVHWRGQPQSETPYMDGMPMITQCPIPSLTTFQYKFRASESGTHVWQVNTGEEILDTLFGPLIVRKPDSKEIHKNLYDTDEMSNVVVIHPWNPQRTNILLQDETSKIKLLINGKTQENNMPPAIFSIKTGEKHRFRVIYTNGIKNCQVRVSIDNHQLLVIALDGHPIKPAMVTSIRLFPGERLDFVLNANQKIGSYFMRVTSVDACESTLLPTSALVNYDEAENIISENINSESEPTSELTEMKMAHDIDCDSNKKNLVNICLRDIHAVNSIPKDLTVDKPDVKYYLHYSSTVVSNQNLLNTTFVALSDTIKILHTNNLTMTLPSSPLLSQAHQINSDSFCNAESIPDRCKYNEDNICECVHVVDIPLNAVVELILVNQDKKLHVLHLHGYSFHIVGASTLPSFKLKLDEIKRLDAMNKLVKRNFGFPVVKDTVAVFNNSVVAVRFKADNPGYWILDEEHASYWSRGMSLVFHVGTKSDLSPIPQNFPKCGDWVGPEFFLV